MNFNEHINKYLFIIPAIIMFFIALIPTLKYHWPLSWDIIYHVQYAKIYAHYGFVLNNPLFNAPTGEKINYPPLFHLLIVALVSILKIDYFQVVKFLQPILSASIVLSVSYVAKEFYGKIAGISAGFLMISSYLITRIILPIPENLALIFLPLAVYFYYRSIKEGILKYALISGIIFILTILIHPIVPRIILLIVTVFTIINLFWDKNLKVLKNYASFLLILVLLATGGLIIISILNPDMLNNIIQQVLTLITSLGTSPTQNKPINALFYLGTIGPLVLAFAAIGGVFVIKKMQKKNIYIIIWILIMFFLSKSYWIGINVISYRVLIYLLIPISILGGFGLSQSYNKLKEYKKLSSNQFRSLFLIAIFLLSSVFGVLTVNDPTLANFGATTEFGYLQIAPPNDSEVDLANWFKENGDKNKSIIISNLYTGTFIATESWMPIHYGFEYFNNDTTQSRFENEKIGYIVYDKRLVYKSKNDTLSIKKVDSGFYPLFYFSKDIKENINYIIPNYAQVVYENDDFIVCKVIIS